MNASCEEPFGEKMDHYEDGRQLVHALLALACIILVQVAGVQLSSYLVGVVLVLGIILVHMKLSGMDIRFLEHPLGRLERPGVTPGYGAITLAAGVLAILTLLESTSAIQASLFILGFGDAASTAIGMRNRKKLPWSRNKTYAGTAAFFLASLPSAYFVGWLAVPVAAIAALAESFESHVDDNLIISVVCVIAFRLLGV